MNDVPQRETRLAVLIPYLKRTNQQADLDATIQSLLRDSYQNWDVFIVDDGSPVPVETGGYGLAERAIQLVQPANQGIERALNRGIEEILARNYAYLARIDAGDEALNDRLLKQVTTLENEPELTLVSCFAEVTDREGRLLYVHRPPTDPAELHRAMHQQNWIVHTGVMLRTSVLRRSGLYRTDFKAGEDYELFFRILAGGGQARTLPEVLVRFDTNPHGISGQRRRRQLISTLRVQLQYFDFRQWRSYFGVLRTSLLFLIPRRWALQLKKSLA
jgi:glycosyltransferase involved in cell wall biosynthesis